MPSYAATADWRSALGCTGNGTRPLLPMRMKSLIGAFKNPELLLERFKFEGARDERNLETDAVREDEEFPKAFLTEIFEDAASIARSL